MADIVAGIVLGLAIFGLIVIVLLALSFRDKGPRL